MRRHHTPAQASCRINNQLSQPSRPYRNLCWHPGLDGACASMLSHSSKNTDKSSQCDEPARPAGSGRRLAAAQACVPFRWRIAQGHCCREAACPQVLAVDGVTLLWRHPATSRRDKKTHENDYSVPPARRTSWHRGTQGVALLRRLKWGALPFANIRHWGYTDWCGRPLPFPALSAFPASQWGAFPLCQRASTRGHTDRNGALCLSCFPARRLRHHLT